MPEQPAHAGRRDQRAGVAVVTPAEMAVIDARAPESTDELIGRAAGAVARCALRLAGGAYGRRMVVVAGPGNNGNDGREAAVRLRQAGVRVEVVDAAAAPAVLAPCDVVIDAAYGTGFRGTWRAPRLPSGPRPRVLAVDIPSGVDGNTGRIDPESSVLAADVTLTFAAAKPGLLLGDGPSVTGDIEVADIGLDTSDAAITWLTAAGVAALWPVRPRHTHKWKSAVWVVAGSPGMEGAAALVCGGAQRCGAGYVRLTMPTCAAPVHAAVHAAGSAPSPAPVPIPVEVVRLPADEVGGTRWAEGVLADADRFGALVVGNGLGRDQALRNEVDAVVRHSPVPVVVDADGLALLCPDDAGSPEPLGPERQGWSGEPLGDHVVLTPHDGEYALLAGAPPGSDRIAAARALADQTAAVVLLKGPTTVVAHPDGRVLLSTTTDARLATAGSGDVLAGMVGALCAQGLEPFEAAGAAAFCHARAADLGWDRGLVASDLIALLPAAIASLLGPGSRPGRGLPTG